MTLVDRASLHGPGPVRVLVVGTSMSALTLAGSLGAEGFEVRTAPNPAVATDALRVPGIDLVLLDLTQVGMDHAAACRRLAGVAGTSLVILTSAGGSFGHDRRSPLGVVDEIIVPCTAADISGRLRRLARSDQRTPASSAAQRGARQLGRIWVDPAGRRATLDGSALELTRIEFDLLDVLSSRPETVFSRVELLERVWGPSWYGDTHVVDVHVSNLRRKLGERNGRGTQRLIETVRGIGFRLTDTDTGADASADGTGALADAGS